MTMADGHDQMTLQPDLTETLAARLADEVQQRSARSSSPSVPSVALDDVSVSFGDHVAVRNTTLSLAANRVTALVGPSGCGKTSILRAVNRLHDHTGGIVHGRIRLGDLDVYGPGTSSELVRSKVGMVFQRPNPFPTMSIFDNVVAGLRFNGVRSKSLLAEAGEAALRHAALWDIVKDRLREPATRLSGGQQQRLCIARALAVEPEVLLMDEPCSALDPVATGKIEALICELAQHLTVVLVTHNMFQAARVSDDTAVFLLGEDRVGELVEVGPTGEVFGSPKDERTRAYVTGHIG
ncbi:MAG TPA: phosphate ABC transporter ATP-binding protein [Acidimicrobiales bacterium]|nr:phosphate ABC transporter ATP-binding protein [Acidimicrobiales bacterium]